MVQGYGRRRILDGVTFTLDEGITALLGPNGAGKSTLMRTLVTDLAPRGGEVLIDGRPVDTRSGRHAARERIGYLPQNFGFDARFRVVEYVEYLAWLRGIPASQRPAAADAAIAAVGLSNQSRMTMGSLSGGMRQRAGIAGAIVGSPQLLVLDEPTVGLDPSQRAEFRRVLTSLPTSRILLSTHLTDDVEAVAQHVIVLAQGQIAHQGPTAELIDTYGSVDAGYLALVDVGDPAGQGVVTP
ncbi:ATP-binding cassette domain-containing protein [Xylanimonas oleitrophica]|nr:ATP-binding cassette domain-containing protein [Xylanimonas oleitrophica]